MKLPRRQFLYLTTTAAALLGLSHIGSAQAYPLRPVRLIVGFPPGGPTDISARLIARWLSEQLGQHFIVENRAGASGEIATEAVVNSPPDGYTLLLVVTANAINAAFHQRPNFNFLRDIAPVASISQYGFILAASPSFPAHTFPQFIAYAKANPGKVNLGSGGVGTPFQLAGELLKTMAGIDVVLVPYNGSAPMIADLLEGRVQVAFDSITSIIGHIRAGRLRALAVTTAERAEVLAGVPTIGEFLPGYEASGWNGLGAPRGTHIQIIEKLNRAIHAGLVDPTLRARLAELGATAFYLGAAEFGRFIAEQVDKWAQVVRFSGLKIH